MFIGISYSYAYFNSKKGHEFILENRNKNNSCFWREKHFITTKLFILYFYLSQTKTFSKMNTNPGISIIKLSSMTMHPKIIFDVKLWSVILNWFDLLSEIR